MNTNLATRVASRYVLEPGAAWCSYRRAAPDWPKLIGDQNHRAASVRLWSLEGGALIWRKHATRPETGVGLLRPRQLKAIGATAQRRHLCRKQGGTSSSLAIIVEARNFSWVTGREHISSYVRPTGFRSDFCAKCGSPVPNPLRTTAYYWVPAGLLDDLETLETGAHLFTGSKASWEIIPSDAPHFETVPKLSQLVELLSSRGR